MQKNIRIIPRLDVKGDNLVKGIHLEGLRVLGKPETFARQYYENGADELIYMDLVASLYGRNSLLNTIGKTSREIFIPLTVGGGLRSLDDIMAALRSGADKVAFNTAALLNPQLISDAANRFGSSTIVISIEAVKRQNDMYEALTDNGRETTGKDALSWAKEAAELGAGEILLTSIDMEGTGNGFDVELSRQISQAVPIPVIVAGGAGSKSDIAEAVKEGSADAICLASLLHYSFLRKDKPSNQNTHSHYSAKNADIFANTTLADIKQHLIEQGNLCRIDQ